jgi:hypothetical protein
MRKGTQKEEEEHKKKEMGDYQEEYSSTKTPEHHQEIESEQTGAESVVNNLERNSDEEDVSVREQECVNMYGADFLKKLITRLT